ncbi:MAG: class I SAM-dependent methyltransferase [Nanoarchaeota archaeon]|nr:class I SAM-dependent methyltransferase [Nanoarchaeota archaeon]MBU1704282.1 class I SAM-dependent methyltransferase [Nanoarchaeota archaeon]
MKGWDEFHVDRKELTGDEPPHPEVVKFAKRLAKRAKVLDHGCGMGRNFFFMDKEGFNVYGIDCSDFSIEFMTKKGYGDKVVKGDIRKMPFMDDEFDALVSTNVIAHGNQEDITRYIKEMRRVVKPGGMIFIVCPSIYFLEAVRTKDTKEVSPGTYVDIDTPDGNMPHYYFTTEIMETFFKGDIILRNEYVDEYSTFMKKQVNHLIFACQVGGK